MNKSITIHVEYPGRIFAEDSQGQKISVIRDKWWIESTPSDDDRCLIITRLEGGERTVSGECRWGDSFGCIMDYFNRKLTELAARPDQK